MKITAPFAASFRGCERKLILAKQTEEKNHRNTNEKQGTELSLPVRDDGDAVPLFKRLTQAACLGRANSHDKHQVAYHMYIACT